MAYASSLPNFTSLTPVGNNSYDFLILVTPITFHDARILPLWVLLFFIAAVIVSIVMSIWLCFRILITERLVHRYARMDVEMQAMGQSTNGARRVSERIPEIVFGTESLTIPFEEEKCPWCQYEFNEGELLMSLPPCGHTFHSHCIRAYLSRCGKCPCCRRIISFPDEGSIV